MSIEQDGGAIVEGRILLNELEYYITFLRGIPQLIIHNFTHNKKQKSLYTECIKYLNSKLKEYYTIKFGRSYLTYLDSLIFYYINGTIYHYTLRDIKYNLTTDDNVSEAKVLYTLLYFIENNEQNILDYYDIDDRELRKKEQSSELFIDTIQGVSIIQLDLQPSNKILTSANLEYQIFYYMFMLSKGLAPTYNNYKVGRKYLHTLLFNKIKSKLKKNRVNHSVNKRNTKITIFLNDEHSEKRTFTFNNSLNQASILLNYFIECNITNTNEDCFSNDMLYDYLSKYYTSEISTSNIYHLSNIGGITTSSKIVSLNLPRSNLVKSGRTLREIKSKKTRKSPSAVSKTPRLTVRRKERNSKTPRLTPRNTRRNNNRSTVGRTKRTSKSPNKKTTPAPTEFINNNQPIFSFPPPPPPEDYNTEETNSSPLPSPPPLPEGYNTDFKKNSSPLPSPLPLPEGYNTDFKKNSSPLPSPPKFINNNKKYSKPILSLKTPPPSINV
jgi:hypothetical protein